MFPSFRSKVDAKWAPLLIQPIEGSYERLVFGVAVVSNDGFHLEIANRLDRLQCLYADQSKIVISVIEWTVESLRSDLAKRSIEALLEPSFPFSGVKVGELRNGEGESLEQIACSWMVSLSSLYTDKYSEDFELELVERGVEEVRPKSGGGDRLPILIKDYIKEKRVGLVPFFSEDVRLERKRRSARRGAEVNIDFAGSKLVANFGTLQANGVSLSSGRIKSRLWELKVNRDADWERGQDRYHEMLIQIPPKNDPQFSAKQMRNVAEALETLEEQADQEEIRIRSMTSVEQIGEHLLELEAA